MSKTILDGIAQIHLVLSLTNPATPSLAQIEAGLDLSGYLRPGGDWSPIEGSTVDAATVDSAFNSTARGTFGGQPFSAIFTNDHEVANDDAWVALPRGTTGFFVVSFYGGSGVGNLGRVQARLEPYHGRAFSATLRVPPLGVLYLVPA